MYKFTLAILFCVISSCSIYTYPTAVRPNPVPPVTYYYRYYPPYHTTPVYTIPYYPKPPVYYGPRRRGR